jgi:protein TonB
VTLRGTITKEGKVTNVSVVSGDPQLTQAAIDAVQRWRYRPYLFMGRPVDVETQMQFKFSLSNGVT